MEKVIFTQIPISELETLIQKCVENAINVKPNDTPSDTTYSDFLTVEQAAKFLALSVPTIYSKVSKRELPFMKASKRLYFSREDLIEYVKNGRQNSMSEDLAHAHKQFNK